MVADGSSVQRRLQVGLGVLWLIGALLQTQPGMFAMDMLSTTMQVPATPQPAWLQHWMNGSVQLMTPHLVVLNWAVVALQLGLAASLLAGRGWVVRAGALISAAWALMLWLFGEGLGQILTGSASPLTGAPGVMLLYASVSLLLLVPGAATARRATRLVGAWLLLAAVLQAAPIFWTSLGLASPVADNTMMSQPHWLLTAVNGFVALLLAAPVAVNLALVLLLTTLGLGLWVLPHQRWVLATSVLWLAAVWVLGEDMGGLFGGMATVPGTAPALLLVLWAGVAHGAVTGAVPARAPDGGTLA